MCIRDRTYILKQFGEQNFQKVHYFNFEKNKSLSSIFDEDIDPIKILNLLTINQEDVDTKEDLVIFDEIQDCPRAFTSLKYFNEEIPELAICSAGSLLGIVLNDESFPVGKVEYQWLGPMNFEEFLKAIEVKKYQLLKDAIQNMQISDFEHSILLESYKVYSITGGMPEVVSRVKNEKLVSNDTFQEIRGIQQNLLNTYLSDFSKHAGKTNASHIASVFQNIPSQLSKAIDCSTKRFTFKNVITGKRGLRDLEGPIDWLCKAGLIYKSKIVNVANFPLESFSKHNMFKLYIFDTGILGNLSLIHI